MEYIKIKDAMIPLKVQTYNNSKSLKLYFKNGILKITKTPYTSQATVDALIEAYKEEIYENFIDIQAKAKGKWSDRKEMLYKGEKYNRTACSKLPQTRLQRGFSYRSFV